MNGDALAASYATATVACAGLLDEVDVVSVAGPGAIAYLETQCSQSVDGLAVGEAVDSLLLAPTGRLDAAVRVVRVGEEEAIVVVERPFGPAVEERLRRFKLRVRAELSAATWTRLVLRGPGSVAIAAGLEAAASLPVAYGPEVGVDLVGPSLEMPDGLPSLPREVLEALRIEGGRPVMGAELDERTIAQEAWLTERAVSFVKGCFPGQELVARIDARGDNVPRRLRGLVAAAPMAPGDAVREGERELGTVTSAAAHPRLGFVALAYLKRGLTPPADVLVGPGAVAARASELPIT